MGASEKCSGGGALEMRPRKVILLISVADCGALKFALETRNLTYRVVQVSGEEDAVRMLGEVDAVVVLVQAAAGMSYANRMTQLSRAMCDAPVMVFDAKKFDCPCFADVTLGVNDPMATLVERLKILAVRNRGPKKKFVSKVSLSEENFCGGVLQSTAAVL